MEYVAVSSAQPEVVPEAVIIKAHTSGAELRLHGTCGRNEA